MYEFNYEEPLHEATFPPLSMYGQGPRGELPQSGMSSMILPPMNDNRPATVESVVPPLADLKLANQSTNPVDYAFAPMPSGPALMPPGPALTGWDTTGVPLGFKLVSSCATLSVFIFLTVHFFTSLSLLVRWSFGACIYDALLEW